MADHDSVVTAWSVPASARAAAPEARRSCSADGPSSPVGPSPTATTSGAVIVPRLGILTTSSARPVAPATASSAASSPSKAASTAAAPGASRGAAFSVSSSERAGRTPTTTASAVAVAAVVPAPVSRCSSVTTSAR